MLVAVNICGILLFCVLMVFAAVAANKLQEDAHLEHPLVGVVATIVMWAAIWAGVVGSFYLACSAVEGSFLMMATKEERQIIEKVRTTKKIQRLKKELHELESRSTEAVQ